MNGEQPIGEPDDGPDHGPADGPGLGASGAGSGVGVVPVVTAARTVFADAVDALASAVAQSVRALPDAGSRELVRDLAEQLARVEAVLLAAVNDLDSRLEAVEGARAGFVAQTFLRVALHRSPRQAARDVAAARALVPSSAGAGTAGEDPFADGEVHAPALGAVLAAEWPHASTSTWVSGP